MRKRRAVRGGPDDVGQVAVPLEEAEQEHVGHLPRAALVDGGGVEQALAVDLDALEQGDCRRAAVLVRQKQRLHPNLRRPRGATSHRRPRLHRRRRRPEVPTPS